MVAELRGHSSRRKHDTGGCAFFTVMNMYCQEMCKCSFENTFGDSFHYSYFFFLDEYRNFFSLGGGAGSGKCLGGNILNLKTSK